MSSSDSEDESWEEAKQMVARRENERYEDDDEAEAELSDSPRRAASPRALSDTSYDTPVLDTSVTSAEHGAGGGRLQLQPADSVQGLDEWSESGWDDERTEADWSEDDQTQAGEPEEDDDTTLQYIAVNKCKEMKIAEVVKEIKNEIFGAAVEASTYKEAEAAAESGRRSPRRISPWTPTESEQLLGALEDSHGVRDETLFETLARQLGREESDVREYVMRCTGHTAMMYVRAYLAMEQLVTFEDRGLTINVTEDNNHLLAAYILKREVDQKPHRALRVDVQQVCDQMQGFDEENNPFQYEKVITGWNILREHVEVEGDPEDPESMDYNLAVDIVETGEMVFALDTTACKDQSLSCVNHRVSGCGMVRVQVVRHYCDGKLLPQTQVDTASEDLWQELEAVYQQQNMKGLKDRADDSLEKYPLLEAEDFEAQLDMLKAPGDNPTRKEDLMELILELEIVRTPLWASLYDEEGARLLELLPQHGDVQPEKPLGFGSRRGVSKSRRTHHLNTSGVGAAAPHSLHVDTDHRQQLVGQSERRAVESMVGYSQRQRKRNTAAKKGPAPSAVGASGRSTSRQSVAGGGSSGHRSMRGRTPTSTLVENLMDKSLYQFLQATELVGCEQKLQRIGVTSPRSLRRLAADGNTLMSKANLTTGQMTRIKQTLEVYGEKQ